MITLHHLDFSRSIRVMWLLEASAYLVRLMEHDALKHAIAAGGPITPAA